MPNTIVLKNARFYSRAGLSQQKPVTASSGVYTCFHVPCLFELMSVM